MTDRFRLISQLVFLSLVAILVAIYLPLDNSLRLIGLMVIFCLSMLMVILTVKRIKAKKNRSQSDADAPMKKLPPVAYQQPIILVTGADLSLFFGEETIIEKPEGCFLRIDHVADLLDCVRSLRTENALWLRQIHAMHILVPERCVDESKLCVELKDWRWQLSLIRREIGQSLCANIVCYFNELWQVNREKKVDESSAIQSQIPWFCQFNPQAKSPVNFDVSELPFEVRTETQLHHSLSTWLNEPSENYNSTQRYAYALKLAAVTDFLYDNILPECWQKERVSRAIIPFALIVHFTPIEPKMNNIWCRQISQISGLSSISLTPSKSTIAENVLPLPDVLFSCLPTQPILKPVEHTMYKIMLYSLLFGLSAIAISFYHNKQLVKNISAHLFSYYKIEMGNEPSKEQALSLLKEDAERLENFYREGEPAHYALGLYQGAALYPHVLKAIKTYIKPSLPEVPKEENKPEPSKRIIHMDALSLFDIGKHTLKQEATPELIRALVDIKATAGYVILITGHTDNTGNEKSNELLSLKRAEAVRDWMMGVSDIPINCFAVQGHGASQPIASNTTELGRQKNRRVEISLVPEISACQHTDKVPSL